MVGSSSDHFVTVTTGGEGTILRPPGAYVVEIGDDLPQNWGVTDAECDDAASEEPSFGDPDAWSATYNLEPEERVRCTFKLAQGEGIIKLKTEPRGREVSLGFEVPVQLPPETTWDSSEEGSGVSAVQQRFAELVDVTAGEQHSFKRGPGLYDVPILSELGDRWEVDKITCEEGAGENPSFGDKATATAIYGIDAEEKVTCTYVVRDKTVPRKGPWRVTETSARMSCPRAGDQRLERSGPQQFRLRIGNMGRRITATGDGRITMREQAPGQYRGRARRARVVWHVQSDKHITGTNTANAGRGCTLVCKFDMRYTGN